MNRSLLPAALLVAASTATPTPATARPSSTISWQGYSWVARTVSGAPGAPGRWSAANVSIDGAGRLHLKVTRDQRGRYAQAELDSLRQGWGYGTYRWRIDTDLSRLAPEYVLGLFTYSQDPAYGHREIDIEAAGWGRTPITWDYTTWADGHLPVARTPAPAGPTSHQFVWRPGKLVWTSWDATGRVFATAQATGADMPVPGNESVGINLWLCGCEAGWDETAPTEVVVRNFRFTPAAG